MDDALKIELAAYSTTGACAFAIAASSYVAYNAESTLKKVGFSALTALSAVGLTASIVTAKFARNPEKPIKSLRDFARYLVVHAIALPTITAFSHLPTYLKGAILDRVLALFTKNLG